MTDLRVGGGARSGIRLFRVFGIEIRLDWSVLIIFALIVYSLGAGLFPQLHDDWSATTTWGTAVAAGIIFFASLLAHELSHSLMARRFGLNVPRITLFLFGGMAEIESEARTPREEFWIAVVGPLMSLALGIMFTAIAAAAMGDDALARLGEDPEATMAGLSAPVTACIWLGSVNLMLALFNLIPGFPLDGGRVFRAVIWWVTGDALRATRVASEGGRLVGWLLVGWGVWNVLVLRNIGGLWLVLIGWFLMHIARASYTQMATERSLRSVRIADVMRTRFDTVPAITPVDRFIEDYLLRSRQQLWPVMEGDTCIGTVAYEDAAAVAPAERGQRRVRELVKALDAGNSLDGDEMATTALRQLMALGDEAVPVVRNRQVVGLIRAGDILRWATLHEPGSTDA